MVAIFLRAQPWLRHLHPFGHQPGIARRIGAQFLESHIDRFQIAREMRQLRIFGFKHGQELAVPCHAPWVAAATLGESDAVSANLDADEGGDVEDEPFDLRRREVGVL